MADIEMVIKIPEDVKEEIDSYKDIELIDMSYLIYAIRNGTPLPKGHGDLIDRKKLINDGINKGLCDWYDEIKYAEAIIKADKESE